MMTDNEETEADYFAMCILIPEQIIRDDCRAITLHGDEIKNLAERYSVSQLAMTLRLSELGIIKTI